MAKLTGQCYSPLQFFLYSSCSSPVHPCISLLEYPVSGAVAAEDGALELLLLETTKMVTTLVVTLVYCFYLSSFCVSSAQDINDCDEDVRLELYLSNGASHFLSLCISPDRKGLLFAIWASSAVRFLKPHSTGPRFVSFFASCRPGRGFSHPQQLHLRGRSRAHTSSSSCGKEDLAVPEKYILAFLRLGEARVAERVRSQEEDL
uniref:Uncharacterized protein n=1 Tax=Populus alba TaxID=43335 RepID=A0A4U5QDE8_POPAL|nr:hypothetical protein D5086_0000098170 [Populus alba]